MKKQIILLALSFVAFASCGASDKTVTLSRATLEDKIRGGWAGQTIGCTYGGPTEFKYNGRMIPDDVQAPWEGENRVKWYYDNEPGIYDDVYMDLSFLKVMDLYGVDAPADSFATAFAYATYNLWHANQAARYNILAGMKAPECGHWKNNPHADDIDFQIEADFAGLISPAMPSLAASFCDKVGHIMNYGDGYYGGLYVAAMYSLAFVEKDIESVVKKALAIIPAESDYCKCVSDAIAWSEENEDWKVTWQKVQDKWSGDFFCPKGVNDPFDIDAKINSAYVVMGLLYGRGDMDKTIDISMRCGQDSDCNPATAAGILGTLLGYSAIPESWKAPLEAVVDRDFAHTDISLNDANAMCMKLAEANILAAGGKVSARKVTIPLSAIEPVAYEKSFEGLSLLSKENIKYNNFRKPFVTSFEGAGLVLAGKINKRKDMTVDPDYVAEFKLMIDGKAELLHMPVSFATRKFDMYWNYELPKGVHSLKMVWTNPIAEVNPVLESVLTYDRQ